MDEIIGLNVGGHIYTTSRSTLIRYPNSMLGNMFSNRLPSAKDAQGNFVIDRDGETFRYILNFLRNSELVVPDGYKELDMLAKEADFYQIQELIMAISDISKPRRVIKIEIREYEQRRPQITPNNRMVGYCQIGIFTDWSIYGSYDALAAVNQATIYKLRKVREFSTLFPDDDSLHICWHDKAIHGNSCEFGYPTALLMSNTADVRTCRKVSEEVTENLFCELFSHGYDLSSKLDTVDSVQEIEPRLKFVTLKSAKTYMFSKY